MAAIILDACFGTDFQEQPAELTFDWRSRSHRHYPDFLVVAGELREFWEIKNDKEAADIRFRRRAERLSELLEPLGYAYRLVAGSVLSRGAYYRNAILLRRFRSALQTLHPRYLRSIPEIPPRKVIVASELLRNIPSGQSDGVLLSLLFEGKVSADLSKPVTAYTNIHPPLSSQGRMPWVWELFGKSN
ncbi:hypothetical protein [Arenimonas sp. SCN 70-307]|uniref:hypothetical protein n=1 Tax=Arenimonas sp. SCN 70-307 TaxID=1660089 RepID=UPI0025BD7CFD|nr:hypothetical protein [Arenimonas sp. SCN 70-307]